MGNVEQTEDEITIDLLEIMIVIKRHLAIIIVAMIIVGTAGGLVTFYFITPQYKATATLIVNARTEQVSTLTNDQLVTSQKLADTYGIIIQSDTILDQVITNLYLDITYDDLKEIITVTSVDDTQIMEVAVIHPDVTIAMEIVREITEIAPDIIAEAVEAGSVKVISSVRGTDNPVSPNLVKNVIICAFLGVVGAIGLVILKELLNNTFKTEEEITKKLGLTVIGVLPKMEE